MTHGRLVVPEGLIIDELARERLTRQVQRQPSDVSGVAAEVGPLPAGASYRVHSEWRSLEPLTACVSSPDSRVRGAVLVRPGAAYEVRDGVVSVDGPVVIDQGAHTHDPRLAVGALECASVAGRPPFPRRPVVVFAAARPLSAELDNWARLTVNRLIRRDVEGRLALVVAGAGLHLTRPCLAGAESVRALAPDVIVTLDDEAAAAAPAWCGADRSTVIIELVDDLAITERLVSWQISRARGRVRAQISRRVGAPALAKLARRLSAGPHVIAPGQSPAEVAAPIAVRENWGARAARATCVVVTDARAAAARRSARSLGLVDQLEAAGVGVVVTDLNQALPDRAASATVVVLAGVDGSPAVTSLLEARAARRLATVLDIGASEFSVDVDAANGSLRLGPEVARLAIACRYVITPMDGLRTALDGLEIRSLAVPTMLTRERASALRTASAAPDRSGGPVLGWYVGSTGEPGPDYTEAVGDGLAKVLADRPDVRVAIVGDVDRISAALRRHDRVSVAAESPAAPILAGWFAHLWTPRIVAGEVVDDLASLVEASTAGVPSVVAEAARVALDGAGSPDLEVARHDEPEAWADTVRRLLDEDRSVHDAYGSDAQRWSQALHGPAACRAIVNRLLGWASYKVKR